MKIQHRISALSRIIPALILAMVMMTGCSVTVGDKSVSINVSKNQTAVAATLTVSAVMTAMPTPVPTLSEADEVQTAVAATLTQVAASQATPAPVAADDTATPAPTAANTATPTAEQIPSIPTIEPTDSPAATATKAPTPTKAKPKAPAPASTPIPKAGFVLDFENFGAWKRGVQPYGELTAAKERSHEGNQAAKLSYDFPKVADDFVVFLKNPPAPIPGEPPALTVWVYGDGSGHFLNVWVIDSQKEVRQFTFGQIAHKDSWQMMTANLDTSADWPQDHISGPDNGKLDYPIRLYALVLDSVSGQPTKGVVYLDELVTGAAAPPTVAPTAASPATTPAPVAAPLSGHIAYAAASGNTTNVMVLDVATGNTWGVFTYGRHPDIRKDGTLLVVDAIGNGRNNLFSLLIDGSHVSQISNHTEDSYPNWSPDDTLLVYHSALYGDGKDRIYIQHNPSEEPAPLRVNGMDAFGRFPVWLPDWRIAYTGCNYWGSGGDCGIWSVFMNDSSGPAVRLTTSPSDISADAYGNNLLYASESSGNWDLYLTPLGGGPLRNLTNNPAQDVAGTFSPDGNSIAFISNRGGVWALWVMNADGGNPRKLKDVPEGFGNDWPTSRISWGP